MARSPAEPYRCTNYGNCGCAFATTAERDVHERFCMVSDPPPSPPDPEELAS